MRRIIFYITIVFIFFAATATAQNLQITAETDSTQYLIGDYIRYDLKIDAPATVTFNWPATDSIGGKLEMISISGIDTLQHGTQLSLHQQIVFSAYDSGIFVIRPAAVIYKQQGDTTMYLALSDSIPLLIQTIPVDTTQAIKPIKENITVKVPDYTLLIILGAIFLAAIAGYIIYRYIQKRKKQQPVSAKPTSISLYNYTMQKLQALEAKKLWQQDAYKQYHTELTDILREYLDNRYDLQTMESTTDEIIELVVNARLHNDLVEYLRFILTTADLAKFAKSKPLPDENTHCMQYAYALVEQTKLTDEKLKEKAQ